MNYTGNRIVILEPAEDFSLNKALLIFSRTLADGRRAALKSRFHMSARDKQHVKDVRRRQRAIKNRPTGRDPLTTRPNYPRQSVTENKSK